MRERVRLTSLGLLCLLGLALLPAPVRAAPSEPGSPVTTWYFAEGSTQPPFDTWFLVQNPGDERANLTFTFQYQTFGNRTLNIIRRYTVGPTSRFSLYANEVVPNVAFSTRIDSDRPVLAERAMYVGYDGTIVAGIPAPSQTWYFAEGSTQSPFHTWLLLQNPNDERVTATVTYLLDDGAPVTQTREIPPRSRQSIFVNSTLADRAFSSRVEANRPIVAERAMYRFPGNAATVVSGVPAPSRTWYFAEGRSFFPPAQGGQGADSWLLLQNPSSTPVTATITAFSREGEGPTATFERVLAPTSRQSIFLNAVRELSSIGVYGLRVEASGDIVAERSVFVRSPATRAEPRGMYATVGATALDTVWLFPEGSTAPPFGELIALLNPNDQSLTARLEFMLPDGRVVTRDVVVPARGRGEVSVGAIVPNTAVSARVTTSLPSVAERIMSFAKGGHVGYHDALGIRP